MTGIFEEWAPKYRAAGLEPRPITPGSKACKIKAWSRPDSAFDKAELERWLREKAASGIGLRLGTDLPDGTKLAVLDIDRDDMVRVARVLVGPIDGDF